MGFYSIKLIYILKQIIFPSKVRSSRPQSFCKFPTIESFLQHIQTQAPQSHLASCLPALAWKASNSSLLWDQRRAARFSPRLSQQMGNLDTSMVFTNGT